MKNWVEKAKALLADSIAPPQNEVNEMDWKLDLSPDKQRLVEHLMAFGNHPGGGYFVFGIGNDCSFPGITADQIETIVNRLTNLGRDAVEPAIQLDHMGVDFDGHPILFVHVPESKEKPVHKRGRPVDETFIRSGATTRAASPREVQGMMLQNKSPKWEDLHATVLKAEVELLEFFTLAPIFKMLEIPAPVSDEETLSWLSSQSFIERHVSGGGYITNLGVISAAKRLAPVPELARKAVRVIEYDGPDKSKARDETEGQLGYAISFQKMFSFICKILPTSEVIEKALRQRKPMYPEIALREILANAMIHQDFTVTGAGPMVEIYSDRIEISNPGKLLPSKTVDRLIGTQPESRNEKLARSFRMYKICEERGSGLIKAGRAVEYYGLPPIKFEQGSNHFKVTLYSPRTFAQMTSGERINACYQHAVLQYLSSSVLTNKSLRERLKMPEKQRSMVSVLIQEAVDKGMIVAANPENKSKKFTEYIPVWAGSNK